MMRKGSVLKRNRADPFTLAGPGVPRDQSAVMQAFHIDQFTPLSGTRAGASTAEASELGLPPGEWPGRFQVTLHDKTARTYEYERDVTSGPGQDGELLGRVYKSQQGDEIQIIND